MKYWLMIFAGLVVIAALAVRLVLDGSSAQPPNYTLIEDGLYMGGHVEAPPPEARAVLNVRESDDTYRTEIYQWQPIPDAAPAPSLDWLRTQVEFIDAQRRANRVVFVHCDAGISRSGLVVVAYLMQQHGWSRDEALQFVRTRRSVVQPRPEFMALLLEWERSLRHPVTATPAPEWPA